MKTLVIAARGLQPGYLGCYGNDWVDTPHLDRLAAEGIVLDRHYADCPAAKTRGSWSGVYQFPQPDNSPPPTADLSNRLADVLEQHGIAHLFLAEPIPLSSRKIDPLERRIRQTLRELDRLAKEPQWLLWLDLPSLHPPWQIPEEFLNPYFSVEEEEENEPLEPWLEPPVGPIDPTDDVAWDRLQFTYAAAVSCLDDRVGALLDAVEKNVLICFMAEDGLALGEHGRIGNGSSGLHDERVHVPCILRLPDGEEAGRRVPALTQPVDLLPTLVDAFGLPLPPVHGCSLLPLVRGQAERVRPYACSGLTSEDALEWALRTPEWTFLLPPRVPAADVARLARLYVRPDDRWEVNNVLHHHQERAEGLERTLRAFVAASRSGGPFSPPELPADS